MPTLSASPLDSWLLSAFPGFRQSKPQGPVPKYACFVNEFRRPVLINSHNVPQKLSRSSSFLLSSISGGDGILDSDEGDISSSSSSSSSSSDESDSSSDYSFLPSSRVKSAADNKGKETKKSPAQTALERALAYKKSKGTVSGQQSIRGGLSRPPAPLPPGKPPQVEILAGKPFQVLSKVSRSSSSPSGPLAEVSSVENTDATPGVQVEEIKPPLPLADTVKGKSEFARESPAPGERVSFKIEEALSALEGAVQADTSLREGNTLSGIITREQIQDVSTKLGEAVSQGPGEKVIAGSATALSAFERANAYKIQQSEMVAALQVKDTGPAADIPSPEETDAYLEVEIYTRDGVIKRKTVKPEKAFSRVKEAKRTGVSQIDFAGLGFADKKKSNTPAGLMKGLEVTAPTNRPEVEIITRQVENSESQGLNVDGSLYKPKVSSWGMFPRPSDISKTYGGGRTITPGENLETEEEKCIREARTKKLLEGYRQRMGLDIDPQIRAQSQKEIRKGESLMEQGSMQEALLVFGGVMDQISFQSDLHGLAALQHAVCLEALGRSTDAKLLYEKLISHPNYGVRKKAKQLLFGFQAMDKLKVSSSYKWDDGLYKNYFSSFADGYNTAYQAEKEPDDSLLLQALPYAILLLPVFLIVSLAVLKGLN